MTSSADVDRGSRGPSRSTSTTRSPTGGPASSGPRPRSARRRSSTGCEPRRGSGATASSSIAITGGSCTSRRRSWPQELVEPFLAALDPPLFDDAIPALEALRGRVKLALLTNNPYGADVLDRHGLHVDVFDSVVVADPVGAQARPARVRPARRRARARGERDRATSATACRPTWRARSARGCARCGSTVGTTRGRCLPASSRITSLSELSATRTMLTVGFDLDMTLVDSRPGHPRQHGRALAGDRRADRRRRRDRSPRTEARVGARALVPGRRRSRTRASATARTTGITASATARCCLAGAAPRSTPCARAAAECWSSPRSRSRSPTAASRRSGLKVDVVVGHVYGDEKRDALLAHDAADLRGRHDHRREVGARRVGHRGRRDDRPRRRDRAPRGGRPRGARLARAVRRLARDLRADLAHSVEVRLVHPEHARPRRP